MANNLLRIHQKASDKHNYSPRVDRLSLPSPGIRRVATADLPTSSPSVQRIMNWGIKQTLCSENVLKSATLAQLKLLQEDVVNWVARRQSEPLIRLKFDNVTKRVPVAAVGKHLPQSSFHTAWGLPSHHDDYIEFLGLRAADGEEVAFEVLEEGGESVLVNWEEWIREDNVYSLLYSDSREDATDLLTAQERQQLLEQFDAIDVNQTGVVTTQELQRYCDKLAKEKIAAAQDELEQLSAKGAQGKKTSEEKERLIRAASAKEAELFMQCDIDEDGTVELHEFFRVRAQQVLSARGVAIPAKQPRVSTVTPRGDHAASAVAAAADTELAAFCPNCGKAFLSMFCTGCGTARGGGSGSTVATAPAASGEEKKKTKKKVVKKKPAVSTDADESL